MMRTRLSTTLVVFGLFVGACGGTSDEPAATTAAPPPAPPTTRLPIATTVSPTTTVAVTTTQAPPPTTTEAPPLPAPAEILAALNTAMARMPEFLGTGQGFVKVDIDTPDDDALVRQLAVGGGPPGGDFWQLTLLEINTPTLSQSFFVQDRTVDGIDYDQDPTTGVWTVAEDPEPDPVYDAFAGQLSLSGMALDVSGDGYVLTGAYPDDPTVRLVTIEVDGSTSLLRSISVRSRVSRSGVEGLITDGDDLYLTQRIDVTTYGLDIGDIAAPPTGIATRLVPDPEAPFMTSIPTDWEQVSAEELEFAGFTDGYIAPSGLALLVLVEDLAGTGITTLGEYAAAIVSVPLAGFEISLFDATSTLQGGFAWIIAGIDPIDGSAFRRLVYVTAEGAGVNLTFIQGPDPETGLPTAAWEESQALIDFMLNSFMVNR